MTSRYEPIYRDGELVSENTHGSYSHRLNAAIGMCYLKNSGGITDEWITSGEYEINIEGKLFPIKIHLEPPYDPKSERVRM
jgi:4-methylaminobutanoate oxidase (formaldehyde-forming)